MEHDGHPDFASQTFEREVEELLWIMEESHSDVNDSTSFSDFYEQYEHRWLETKDTIAKTYNIEVDIDDCLWETAERIRDAAYGEE